MAQAAEVKKAAGPADRSIDAFIERWSKAGGSERANYQLFSWLAMRILLYT
ncbi:MAG: hypothetical protein JNL99_11580 [Zoogloea sp.]|nr:hypothetical protein [Zoogloea sp.]